MESQQKNNHDNSEKDEIKVWLGTDGIIRAQLKKTVNEKDVEIVFDRLENLIRASSGQKDILININSLSIIRSSQFRKRTAERIITVAKSIGFRKVALFSSNVIVRTIASFIVAASKISNMKVFANEEEALTWLKQP